MTAAQLQGNTSHLLKPIGQTQGDRKQPPTNALSSNNPNPFSNNKQASSSSSMISPNKIPNNSQNQPFFLNQPFANKTHPHQNNGMSEGVSNANDMANRLFNSSSSSSSRMNQQQHFINQQSSSSSHHQQLHGNRQSPFSTSPPAVNHSQNNQANSQLSHLINQNNHNQMQKNMLGSSTGLNNNSNNNPSRIMPSHQQIQHHASHHQPAHSLIQNQSINR